MPSRVEADLPDPEPSDSLDTAVEIQNRVSEYDTRLPERIGRYRVDRLLGKGGFGLVFLAYDEQLERHVAVKVPHAKLVSRPEDAEAYLTEARTVASLDHPHIVAVHDVGSTEQFPCYVVSKYIAGTDLSTRLNHSRLDLNQSAELVATVADALHYAHKQGLVHRDIKPGNILIDKMGTAFVVDFGLALREQDLGKGPRYAGTPAYMSPEQARGEGHRVDGRSDVFSLAVVLYELLVGRRPFTGETSVELLEAITKLEPKPPRQIDDKIPKELERICLKAMSKRASERYSTAKDMADDLSHFLTHHSDSTTSVISPSITPDVQPPSTLKGSDTPSTPISDSKPIKIVPKGLRSFDAHDADFFLELLPGPRDRDGLPDSLRFWKTRIEETDADQTFSVGFICGPSGCGKSSLMKAGLMPRLSENVIAVYVEATAEETEARLLNGLRKRCHAMPDNLSLKETLAVLRRGQGLPVGKKILIVLDQFEQWLHAKKEESNTELVEALRQCDGGHLQCIVMVRDDFWMAAIRFMRELEVRLVEGQNSAAVDLFDLDHSRRVLAAFGRAFGKLPEIGGDTSKDQKDFLNLAVSSLAQEGKVISVRLALFAEMMKGKSWTSATLKEMGGTEGVGVTFLEETFGAATAPPEHRYHQKAARAVLKSLLPESGTDIKGHMRSRAELLEASGYQSRTKDFDDLIRILDSGIRLITPTDPEGQEESSASLSEMGKSFYQLTHDYLVFSLRDWLTRKQKETRRGRAELLLADRAGVWNAGPENRQLPSLFQWIQIRWWTQKKNWTATQRKMMGRAGKYHAIWGTAFVVLLAVTTLTGLYIRGHVNEREKATHAAGLVQAVLSADTAQVPAIISQMSEYRKWTDPLLRQENEKATMKSPKKLHASLALLPLDPSQLDYLYDRLLEAKPDEVPVIREALIPCKDALRDKLWAVAEALANDKNPQRLRAASALAKYDPESDRWAKVQEAVGNDLVNVPAVYLAAWMDSLRPVRVKLLAPLRDVYRTTGRKDVERSLATDILADYAADQPQVLADLLMDADETQFAKIFPKFVEVRERGLPVLADEIDKSLPSDIPSSDENREKLAKRQANAAVALLRMNQPENVWPILKHSPDPRARSYLTHRLSPLGADPKSVEQRLDDEPDITVRRALLLSLGEFAEEQLPVAQRTPLIAKLLTIYEAETDSGLHGAAEWLLRRWGQSAKLKALDDQLRTADRDGQLDKVLYAPRTAEQQQRLTKLLMEIEEIRKQCVECEQSLPLRQITWERKRIEQPPAFAESLNEGLVAYYPLDEAEGLKTANVVSDQPDAIYQGPETGKPEWVPGIVGHALRLNGTGTVVDGKPLELEGDQPFSYGCWFQYDSKLPMILLSSREQSKGFRGFDLSLENDHQLRMEIAGEDPHLPDNQRETFSPFLLTVITKTTIDPKRKPGWHHVMVTYDGSTKAKGVSIFVDGQPQPTSTLNDNFVGTIKSASGFYIGSRQWGNFRFRGQIDDVRIYNRRLTEQEVQQIFESGIQAVIRVAPAERTFEQQRLLGDLYRPLDELAQLLLARLLKAEKSLREAANERKLSRLWFVNGQGQTLAVIPGPVEFVMGTPPTEVGRLDDERQHKRRIGRTFAISTKLVTLEQYRQFEKGYALPAKYTRTAELPVIATSWYQAAEYCNWLSKQEGIEKDQWCYLPNKEGQFADDMSLAPGYLSLTGYRLPTEAEVEYVTRAGALTRRFYGETDELLTQYGWYQNNSAELTWPVGSLKPNDLGLFDVQGNAWMWCQDVAKNYPQGAETSDDEEKNLMAVKVKDADFRVLRGGSFRDLSSYVRSAYRLDLVPPSRDDTLGFRLARTLPLVPLTALPSPEAGEIEKTDK